MSQSPDLSFLQACLHFLLNPSLQPATRLALAQSISTPIHAFSSTPPESLCVDRAAWQAWLKPLGRVQFAAQQTARWLSSGPDRQIVSFWDSHYPAVLRELPRPPWLLFIEGQMPACGTPHLAIVGSRSASQGGLRRARSFSRAMAEQGWTIVSGMARGIDGAAHLGALDAGKPTIAVLGCGIDVVYPPEHDHLRQSILDGGGTIVSECPPGTPPSGPFFPMRNRIIAAWSLGVLVVEAAVRSGSLITARQANELGRTVMAMPGSLDSAQSRGCHRMIRQGAALVETIDDILDDLLGPSRPQRRASQSAQSGKRLGGSEQTRPDHAALSPDCSNVLSLFKGEALQFDDLARVSGLPASSLSGLLLELELTGALENRPGQWWVPT